MGCRTFSTYVPHSEWMTSYPRFDRSKASFRYRAAQRPSGLVQVSRQYIRNNRESTARLCIDVVSLQQSQMVRVFGLQSRDQKFELGKAA